MIEDELRAAFARREGLVPEPGPLRRAIDRLAARRRRRRWAVRATGAALAVLAVLALPGLGRSLVGAGAPGSEGPVGTSPTRTLRPGPLNFLVLGLDRHKDWTEGRADTIIIVHVPATRDRAYLISVPRDIRVRIPAFAKSGFPGGFERINAAFYYGSRRAGAAMDVAGGTELTAMALRELTGLTFDGAAVVEFEALRRITDAVGGVGLCLDHQIRSIHTGTVYPAGCQQLNGAQALDVIRQRHGLPKGDLDRQVTAQEYLAALAHEIGRLDLAEIPRLMAGVGTGLTVDTRGVPLPELVFQLRAAVNRIVGVRLMADFRVRGSYLEPDPAVVDGLFGAVRRDALATWLASHPELVGRQR